MPTREEKNRIREMVEGIEKKVSSGQTVSADQVQAVADEMSQLGFSPESDYYNRLEILYQRVTGAPEARPAPAQDNDKLRYIGVLDSHVVYVRPNHNHIILGREYSGKSRGKTTRFRITHRFNEQGRIDFVDAILMQSLSQEMNGVAKKLITVDNYEKRAKDWKTALAYPMGCLPFEMIFFEKDYFRNGQSSKYQRLLENGHVLAENIFTGLGNRSILPVNITSDSDRQLHELVSDVKAMQMLERVSALRPVAELDGIMLKIRYG